MEDAKTPRTLLSIFLILLATSLVIAIDIIASASGSNPVIAITSLTPNPAAPGQQVRLNFTNQASDGVITSTWVDWGDGTAPDLTYNMTSGSMCQRMTNSSTNLCTLALGSLIAFKPQAPSSITPTCAGGDYTCRSPPTGTIIVFRPPGPFSNDPSYLVVDRVVAERQTGQGYYFYTRGDANFAACGCPSANDPWDSAGGVPAAKVVGVYQYTLPERGGGPTARFFTHTYSGSGNSTPKNYAISINCTSGSSTGSAAAYAYATETVEPLQTSNMQTIMGLTPAVFYGLIAAAAIVTVTVAVMIRRRKAALQS